MKKRVLYSEANYAAIVRKQGYFVDKTAFIEQLEQVQNPVFLRPRRFGKSMFCSIMRYYYDRNYAADFDELFGHTWIGRHPTGQQNQHLVLFLNFSTIATGPTIQDIEASFKRQCNHILNTFCYEFAPWLAGLTGIDLEAAVADNLSVILDHIRGRRLPQMYIIIDEYDNFANQLVTGHKDLLYRQLTAEDSFFKSFFKTLKEGRETGGIANVYITGVLPILIDELASGFNIATILTLDRDFEAMLGFTQSEVDQLLDEVYVDYEIDPATRSEVDAVIKNHYNGYHFVDPHGEALYNSTILMYFLNDFTRFKQMPEYLTDLNLRTDLGWVRRLTSANPGDTEAFVTQLTTHNQIAYDKNFLTTKFNTYQFFEPGFYPISFFYLGMLTQQDNFFLRLPNQNMRQIFVEYFNELHRIDVSTRYSELMQSFVNQPDLEQLFAGYWREYISQFPEAIFTQVNENFYRSTFFELCSRYLSRWFTWNVERSYPTGKSDLEFVGKFHEKFAGLRWVIEFKYYSNSEFRRLNTTIEDFELQPADTAQVAGYVQGLRAEYPEAQIAQYVIYCFGNQGYRVFTLE
ncbi:MAG: AAA family ATPase [Caldilineaceae bacterium]